MTKKEIVGRLQALVEDQMEVRIKSPEEIIELDSFTMMLLVMFAEDEFGVQLNMDVLSFDEPRSLNSFSELILRQREGYADSGCV